jgi:regulator of protease activity HflC (stomatin/prohibitin superfamily)
MTRSIIVNSSRINNLRTIIARSALLGVLVAATGCDNLALQQVRNDQVALRFRKLPIFLGGGIRHEVIPPGGKVIVWPWEELIQLTNTQRSESWGTGQGNNRALAARSSDGNEVAFEVTVLYQISRKPEELRELVTSIADTDEKIHELVVSQVRALVRQFANRLATRQFVSSDLSSELCRVEKIAAVSEDTGTFDSVKDELEKALSEALQSYHLELIQLSVANPRFVRYRETDAEGEQQDDTYQTMLVNVQREQQEIKRESESRKTQEERKYEEKEIAIKEANKVLAAANAEAERIGEEARFMLETKQIEKDAIERSGQDMLKSLRAQIEAVAGKGGEALLKLDIARELSKGNPSFIVLNQGSTGSSLDVRRTDTNDLIKQLGLLEALRDKGQSESSSGAAAMMKGEAQQSPKQ